MSAAIDEDQKEHRGSSSAAWSAGSGEEDEQGYYYEYTSNIDDEYDTENNDGYSIKQGSVFNVESTDDPTTTQPQNNKPKNENSLINAKIIGAKAASQCITQKNLCQEPVRNFQEFTRKSQQPTLKDVIQIDKDLAQELAWPERRTPTEDNAGRERGAKTSINNNDRSPSYYNTLDINTFNKPSSLSRSESVTDFSSSSHSENCVACTHTSLGGAGISNPLGAPAKMLHDRWSPPSEEEVAKTFQKNPNNNSSGNNIPKRIVYLSPEFEVFVKGITFEIDEDEDEDEDEDNGNAATVAATGNISNNKAIAQQQGNVSNSERTMSGVKSKEEELNGLWVEAQGLFNKIIFLQKAQSVEETKQRYLEQEIALLRNRINDLILEQQRRRMIMEQNKKKKEKKSILKTPKKKGKTVSELVDNPNETMVHPFFIQCEMINHRSSAKQDEADEFIIEEETGNTIEW